jgi:hypothetical protein
MRHTLSSALLSITVLTNAAVASPPDYSKVIVGHWRIHISQRADRIIIFHSDGSWGVRNWDFSKPEDIRGRRWHVEGDKLIITAPPEDGAQTAAEKIVSFTHAAFVTEVNGVTISYRRIKHWPPKSPNQSMEPTASRCYI